MSGIASGPPWAATLTFLHSLRDQFLAGAKAHPDLTFHYEEMPRSESKALTPSILNVGFSMGMTSYRFTFDGNPGFDSLHDLGSDQVMASWYSGSGRETFLKLAADATGLLEQLRPTTPLIPPLNDLRSRLPQTIMGPDEMSSPIEVRNPVIIPGKEACWARYLLMLGWAGIPIAVPRLTWDAANPHVTTDVDGLESMPVEMLEPFPDMMQLLPVKRFRSEMGQLFARSAAALDWIAEHSTVTPAEPEHGLSPATTGEGTPSAVERELQESPNGEAVELLATPDPVAIGEPSAVSVNEAAAIRNPAPPSRMRKEPSAVAFRAYSLYVDGGHDQATVARKLSQEQMGLTGKARTIDQGQVSRMVNKVREWRGAGNPWPEAGGKVIPTDPSKLDRGPRLDGKHSRRGSGE